MGFFQNRKARLFEERLADMFKTMVMISETVTNSIKKDNMLIKIEVVTYLFSILDYSLVANKVGQEIREAINKMFDEMFKRSKHWKGLNLNNINRYVNDRMQNYSDILQYSKGMNECYYESVIEYQTQLIAWILKEDQVRFGFIAIPKLKEDYKPLVLDALLLYQVKSTLMTFYTDVFIKFTGTMLKNANEGYFLDKRYKVDFK